MGKMGSSSNWLSAVKKAFMYHLLSKGSAEKESSREASRSQERKALSKEKNRWSFRRCSTGKGGGTLSPREQRDLQEEQHRGFQQDQQQQLQAYGGEQQKQALAVAAATAAAAEAAVAAAQAAVQVVKLTNSGVANLTPRASRRRNAGSREEWAAVRIQAAVRAYLARRALRALKGLAKLQELARGRAGHRQASTTMRCLQALVRAQAAVRGRRVRLCDLHPPPPIDKEPSDTGAAHGQRDEWDHNTQPIEEIQARLLSKEEAAIKRERALAYAFSHQTVGAGIAASGMRSQLGWNWLERWMAARPWDNRRPSPAKETPTPGRRQPSPARRVSPARFTPSTPPPRRQQSASTPRSASPTLQLKRSARSLTPSTPNRTLPSVSSLMSSRHSVASSTTFDDLSVASYAGTPSYMASTESARAKLRSHSTPKQRPSSAGSAASSLDNYRMTPSNSARKHLSFASPNPNPNPNLVWRPPPNSRALQRNLSFEHGT